MKTDYQGNIVFGTLFVLGVFCTILLGFMDKSGLRHNALPQRNSCIYIAWEIDSLNAKGIARFTASDLECKDLNEFFALDDSLHDARIVSALDSLAFAHHLYDVKWEYAP